MKVSGFRSVVLAGLLLGSAAVVAQEKGQWRAASKTARAMTGDVAFSATKMSLNFFTYTIAQLRTLTPAEISVVFDGADGAAGTGNIYRLDIPGTKKFVGKNTLCGSEDVEYVVTYVNGRELQMALFSGSAIPALTGEAMANATNFCGTFSYTR